jgi:hypothetical protein
MAGDGTNAADLLAATAGFTTDGSIEEPKSFVPIVKGPPLED